MHDGGRNVVNLRKHTLKRYNHIAKTNNRRHTTDTHKAYVYFGTKSQSCLLLREGRILRSCRISGILKRILKRWEYYYSKFVC